MTMLLRRASTASHRASSLAFLATAAAITLALTGCAPDSAPETTSPPAAVDTATPTPTATATGAAQYAAGAPVPTSEKDAITAATAVIGRYMELANESQRAGGAPAEVTDVAVGTALSSLVDSAQAVGDEGEVVTGDATLEILSSRIDTAADAPADQAFIQVAMSACFDGSGRTRTLADGSASPQPPSQRSLRDVVVGYNTDSGGWRVVIFERPGVEGTC